MMDVGTFSLARKEVPCSIRYFLTASTIHITVTSLALWLFGLIVFIRTAISLNSIFNVPKRLKYLLP